MPETFEEDPRQASEKSKKVQEGGDVGQEECHGHEEHELERSQTISVPHNGEIKPHEEEQDGRESQSRVRHNQGNERQQDSGGASAKKPCGREEVVEHEETIDVEKQVQDISVPEEEDEMRVRLGTRSHVAAEWQQKSHDQG